MPRCHIRLGICDINPKSEARNRGPVRRVRTSKEKSETNIEQQMWDVRYVM
jgi:hypothetical protein